MAKRNNIQLLLIIVSFNINAQSDFNSYLEEANLYLQQNKVNSAIDSYVNAIQNANSTDEAKVDFVYQKLHSIYNQLIKDSQRDVNKLKKEIEEVNYRNKEKIEEYDQEVANLNTLYENQLRISQIRYKAAEGRRYAFRAVDIIQNDDTNNQYTALKLGFLAMDAKRELEDSLNSTFLLLEAIQAFGQASFVNSKNSIEKPSTEYRVIDYSWSPTDEKILYVVHQIEENRLVPAHVVKIKNVNQLNNAGITYKFPKEDELRVTALAFSPQGNTFAVGTKSGSIFLFDTNGSSSNPIAYKNLAYKSQVNFLKFTADGNQLISSSNGNSTSLWSWTYELNKVGEFENSKTASIIEMIEFDPYYVGRTSESEIHIWAKNDLKPIDTYPMRYYLLDLCPSLSS